MPFTLMPFLYQTRTILRISPPRAPAGISRSLHATTCRASRSLIPFAHEIGRERKKTNPAEVDYGTITPTERRIFERIFADIEARALKPAVEDNEVPEFDPPGSRSARLIMQEAAKDAGQAGRATVASPAFLSGAATDRAKALLRFPLPLRNAAEKALNAITNQALGQTHPDAAVANEEDDFINAEWQTPAHTFARTVEIEARRHPERTRVEGLITSANSDFELWDILETEVFTMPARLGILRNDNPFQEEALGEDDLEEATISHDGYVLGEDTSPGESSKPGAEPHMDENSDSVPSRKLNLYVFGPLYPAYLLLALRRLDTAFGAPSSLVFSVLPRIKELGLESYILGVSTPFFNELLNIYWTRRGDLAGVLNLLEEMRHCGLYFDNQTAALLNQVDTTMYKLSTRETGGSLGRALMHMPEYEFAQRDRIRHWHRVVDLSARERQADIEFAEKTT